MSLKEPTSKMSKSHINERSRILLTDSTKDIHKKIKSALTDSEPKIGYDPVRRPGVSNLIEILSHFEERPSDELGAELECVSIQALKERVATVVSRHLEGIRERYFTLIEDKTGYLDSVAEAGARAARANTDVTMNQVKRVMGLGG